MLQVLTEAKKTNRMKIDEVFFKTLVDKMDDYGVFSIDKNGIITSWNIGAKQIFGYNANEIIGKNLRLLYTDEDNTNNIAETELKTAEQRGTSGDERWHIRKDSTLFWATGFVIAMKDDHGNVIEFTKFVRDYTSRKLQIALPKSTVDVMESISDAFFALDKDFNFIYMNKKAEQILMRKQKDLLGKHLWDEFKEAVGTPFYKNYVAAMKSGRSVYFEEFYPPLKKWFRVHAYPSKDGLAVYFMDVSKEKQSELILQESEKRYKNLYETMIQGVIYYDINGHIISANQAMERILGVSSKDLVKKKKIRDSWITINEAGKPFPEEEDPIEVALKKGKKVKNIIMGILLTENAEYRWLKIDAVPQFLPGSKKPYQVYAIFDDITEQKRIQHMLDMRLKLQKAISTLGHKALSQTPLEELFQEAAEQLSEILQVEYVKILELLPDEKNLVIRAGVGWNPDVKIDVTTVGIGPNSQAGYTLMTKKPVIVKDLRVDKRFKGPPLLKRHKVISGMSVILQGNEGPYGVLGVHTKIKRIFTHDDIYYLQSVGNMLALAIQQNQTEQELRDSEEYLRQLAETIPQLVWITRPDGYHEFYNKRWYEFTRLTHEESIGKGWSTLLHPDDVERSWKTWEHCLKTGEQYEIEYRFKDVRTGEYRWFLGRALPVRDSDGDIIKWFGTCTDIHEQKKTLEELERSQKQFSALFSSSVIGVLYCDLKGKIFNANDAFLDMIGYSRQELENGKIYWDKLTPSEFKESDQFATQALMKTGVAPAWEKEYIRKDGSQIPVIVGAALLNKDTTETIAFVIDNSERKKLEARKDEFIGIASHELKTPLTSIKGYTQILERIIHQMGDARLQLYLKKTNTYIDRLNSLISDLLDVSKIQAGKLQMDYSRFKFSELLNDGIESMLHTHENHEIELDGDVDEIVYGDRHRLEQVITNLLSNAIKYSPRANKVRVHVKKADKSITVGVTDFGIGIPESEQHKLFQRFYRVETTAKRFSGLGIGLYVSSEIVQRHGGKMWVESVPGQGSTFYFTLPITKHLHV